MKSEKAQHRVPPHDLAHIGYIELLTPRLDESLRFFADVLGMEEEGRGAKSVYLRGWGEYQRYSVKLTESSQPGIGHIGLRAWSPTALEQLATKLERAGRGIGWLEGDLGRGPAYRFNDPDGHSVEIYYEAKRYVAPEPLRPMLRNQPQRYTGRGAAIKRLDHVNLLAQDVAACRTFATDVLGYRHYEGVVGDGGRETAAWLSLSIAAHELVYFEDPRRAHGRLHHVAFWVDTREEVLRAADIFLENDVAIEFGPSKHAITHGFFLYGFEPGGNRIEVTTGGYFVYDPDWEPVIWSQAERARGQAWGLKAVESFLYYATPPVTKDEAAYVQQPASRAGVAHVPD